jgi:chromatin remodeling complex protein RSC6
MPCTYSYSPAVAVFANWVWAHIKKHKLQNPQNKREIIADDKLQPIFGGKKMDMFQMTKAVTST